METEDTFNERLLYTLLLGVFTGAAGLFASRAVAAIWSRWKHRPAPKPLGFVGSLSQKAGTGAAARLW